MRDGWSDDAPHDARPHDARPHDELPRHDDAARAHPAPHEPPARHTNGSIPITREPEVADVGARGDDVRIGGAAEVEEAAFCELLSDAYVRTDAYGVVRRANAAAADLFGRPLLWLTGKPLVTFVAPEQRQEMRRLVNELRDASGARHWTLAVQPAAGEPCTVAATVAPVRVGGAVVGARWVLRTAADPALAALAAHPAPPPSHTTAYFADFLARISGTMGGELDHRELLRTVAQHAVPALGDWCIVDVVRESGRLERVAAAHTALEDPRQLAAILTDVPARDGSHPVADAVRTRRTQLVTGSACTECLPADGPNATAWLAVPMVARGAVLGVLSFVIARSRRGFAPLAAAAAEELGRRVALHADNALLYRRAVRASEAKSAFLGTISHELRTPLTAVIGYSELLADGLAGPLDERQADFVHRIRESGDHLLHLVEEVLGFARLEAHEERAACEPVDVAAAVVQACSLVEPQARRRGLALECDVAVPPGLVVHTDPTKLRQILVNLLGNAVKFTDVGTVRVYAAHDAARRRAEFSVQDTGIGIAPDLLPHVFDPFWQVEQTTTRARGGAGLGLSVVRQLSHLLGGDVTVASEVGVGSCFRVWLPTHPAGAGERA